MKVLIIRFSSFGDVLQTLSVAGKLGQAFASAEIHWVTRQEYVPVIESHPSINKVWSLNKGAGLSHLWKLSRQLRQQGFTHIYDAHNNLRSHLLTLFMMGNGHRLLRRPIYRWKRFLLFKFKRNMFPQPFSGQFALLEPLQKWGLNTQAPPVPQLFLGQPDPQRLDSVLPQEFTSFVALAPSAAYELKRWPLEHWRQLIELCPQTRFVLLGGPEDKFLEELQVPGRVINLAGKLSLLESAQVIARSQALVANDTGLMHVAEQTGKPCLALMGPAPFGFPSRPQTRIFQLDLDCRPCSKHGQGPCVNREFHKCMRDISPASVASGLKRIVNATLDA